MVQRIDMGVGVAVARHAEIAHAEGKAALADRQIMHQRHEMHRRVWIVGTGFLVDRNRHRDATAFADERGGGGHLVRGDIVERAKLVVCPPSAPVLELFEHRIECGQRHGCGWGQGSGHGRLHWLPKRGNSAASRRDRPVILFAFNGLRLLALLDDVSGLGQPGLVPTQPHPDKNEYSQKQPDAGDRRRPVVSRRKASAAMGQGWRFLASFWQA